MNPTEPVELHRYCAQVVVYYQDPFQGRYSVIVNVEYIAAEPDYELAGRLGLEAFESNPGDYTVYRSGHYRYTGADQWAEVVSNRLC